MAKSISKTGQSVNFISHYRAAMDRFAQDRRITAAHLALYQALFYFWNLNRFPVSFPIARDDIMRYAHIGSITTYSRAIKDLHAWGYIIYQPTNDPRYRTQVSLYRFDKGIGQGADKGIGQGADKGVDNGVVQPHLNSIINETNTANEPNESNDYGNTKREPNVGDTEDKRPQEVYEEISPKPGNSQVAGGGPPRSLEEVRAYFHEQNFPLREAEKFYNYFGSVGWTVGKSQRPMRDWRLGANHWMLNAKQMEDEKNVKPGDKHVPKDRNYDTPL